MRGAVEFVYLTGLPMDDLLREVARLPERSIVYYLHLFEDGRGETFVPAEAAERLAAAANAPVYGLYRTYLGRGIVGGRVVSFEAEGEKAARLALRVLAGEKPESIARPEASENPYVFDWRQLRRWGIEEDALPHGSVVLYKQPSFWDLYRWRIIGVISLCIVEALLIVGLLVERANRRRADEGLRESQRELRALTGRLLQAQETERRRIARELHDDLNQGLALLAVHLDLLGQRPPESGARFGERMREMSDRVKQLSSVVHGLSTVLHPSKLEQLGLVAAVRGLCKELTQAHGLAIEFVDQTDAVVDPRRYRPLPLPDRAGGPEQRHQAQRRPACPGRAERRRGRGLPADRRRRGRVRRRHARSQGGARAGQHAGEAAPGRRRDRHRLPTVGRHPDRRPRPAPSPPARSRWSRRRRLPTRGRRRYDGR